jgi:hypothetical protein
MKTKINPNNIHVPVFWITMSHRLFNGCWRLRWTYFLHVWDKRLGLYVTLQQYPHSLSGLRNIRYNFQLAKLHYKYTNVHIWLQVTEYECTYKEYFIQPPIIIMYNCNNFFHVPTNFFRRQVAVDQSV